MERDFLLFQVIFNRTFNQLNRIQVADVYLTAGGSSRSKINWLY